MEEYFNEKSIADLDFTGFTSRVKVYVEKRFRLVRSSRLRLSPFDHKITLCLISNVELGVVKVEKDEKLNALLESNRVLKQIYSELSKYQHFFKVNLSAGSVIVQENNSLRYLYAHKSNYLLLPEAFTVGKPSDLRDLIFFLDENDFLNPEKFFVSDSKSRRLITPCLALHLSCDPSRLLLSGRPPATFDEYWVNSRSVYTLDKDSHRRVYNDNLCAFRAVAVFMRQLKKSNFQPQKISRREVDDLYYEYRMEVDTEIPDDSSDFSGSSLDTIGKLCYLKGLNVMVFST